MLTLKDFEEAVDVVKKVAIKTELIYSDYLSEQTGNKIYLKPETFRKPVLTSYVAHTTRSAL